MLILGVALRMNSWLCRQGRSLLERAPKFSQCNALCRSHLATGAIRQRALGKALGMEKGAVRGDDP